VFASVDPRNHASIALLRRVGMRQEAHFRQSLWWRGEWVDDVIFAVLQSEWKDSR
jgi:RimJ/RimL family protein N-acetyltransferase